MSLHDVARRRWEKAAGATLALAIGLSLAGGAMAANTVNTQVTGGTRTASIQDLSLGSILTAHTDQTKTGTMLLTADDSSGTNAGWNVTILASDFGYVGVYSGTAIPAVNFGITTAKDPVKTAGQGVSPTQGPKVPVTNAVGTLDQTRKVVQSNVNHGKGTYTQGLDVSLTVPADSAVGVYTSTLVVTIAFAP